MFMCLLVDYFTVIFSPLTNSSHIKVWHIFIFVFVIKCNLNFQQIYPRVSDIHTVSFRRIPLLSLFDATSYIILKMYFFAIIYRLYMNSTQ